MNKKCIYILLALSILTGCVKKNNLHNHDLFQQQEIIAKFAELPDVPFQVCLKHIAVSDTDHQQLQIFYTFTMPIQELILFYHQQMERLGWELLAESNVKDFLLHYSKPNQLCSILIGDNQFSIYICKKKGA